MRIKVVKSPEYLPGSARAIWFKSVRRYDGKDLDRFVAATVKNPPTLTRSGEAEPPTGWVRFFEQEGVIKVT